MIKCLIIEDQDPAQRILKKYIEDLPDLELIDAFNNAIDALDFLKTTKIDLIFLDIHLPKLSGMDFLTLLNRQYHVILTTAYDSYALKSYEFGVVDYLLKPFSFDRFVKAVYKVKKLMNQNTEQIPNINNNSILIKVGYDLIKIQFENILYIKSDGDYTQVICKEKKHLVSYALKYWQSQLPKNIFYKVHRSYIVNINAVEMVSAEKVFINEKTLPIGRVYKKDFLNAFNTHYKL